jgi:cytochrome b subunit of formate dehydrogenase
MVPIITLKKKIKGKRQYIQRLHKLTVYFTHKMQKPTQEGKSNSNAYIYIWTLIFFLIIIIISRRNRR